MLISFVKYQLCEGEENALCAFSSLLFFFGIKIKSSEFIQQLSKDQLYKQSSLKRCVLGCLKQTEVYTLPTDIPSRVDTIDQ